MKTNITHQKVLIGSNQNDNQERIWLKGATPKEVIAMLDKAGVEVLTKRPLVDKSEQIAAKKAAKEAREKARAEAKKAKADAKKAKKAEKAKKEKVAA